MRILLFLLTLQIASADPLAIVPLSQLGPNAQDSNTLVALRNGTLFLGRVQKVDRRKGIVRFASRPPRDVACAEIETITSESAGRDAGRVGTFAGLTVGAFFGGAYAMYYQTTSASPALLVASPILGWLGSRHFIRYKARAFRVAC